MIPEKDIRNIFETLFCDFSEINWRIVDHSDIQFNELQMKDLKRVVCEIIEKYKEVDHFENCKNCERSFPDFHLKNGLCHDCVEL